MQEGSALPDQSGQIPLSLGVRAGVRAESLVRHQRGRVRDSNCPHPQPLSQRERGAWVHNPPRGRKHVVPPSRLVQRPCPVDENRLRTKLQISENPRGDGMAFANTCNPSIDRTSVRSSLVPSCRSSPGQTARSVMGLEMTRLLCEYEPAWMNMSLPARIAKKASTKLLNGLGLFSSPPT